MSHRAWGQRCRCRAGRFGAELGWAGLELPALSEEPFGPCRAPGAAPRPHSLGCLCRAGYNIQLPPKSPDFCSQPRFLSLFSHKNFHTGAAGPSHSLIQLCAPSHSPGCLQSSFLPPNLPAGAAGVNTRSGSHSPSTPQFPWRNHPKGSTPGRAGHALQCREAEARRSEEDG